ncbi:CHAP domain-containing protein [Demequina aestuarii]|uniref:CHAP domain-containing protein n=1 Tax=Demequina aestuarii TaxID=327095 RepID=UPI0007840764|nr:CHAP domain-containing protein [Demequina aestuarii]
MDRANTVQDTALGTRVRAWAAIVMTAAMAATFVTMSPAPAQAAMSVTVTAPSQIDKGTSVRINVETSGDWDGYARIELSYDGGSSWSLTEHGVPIVNGYGTEDWLPTGTATYRVRTDEFTSAPFRVAVRSYNGFSISGGISAPRYRYGESLWINGYAAAATRPVKNGLVIIESSTSRNGSYSLLTSIRTDAKGYYYYRLRPTDTRYYRTRLLDANGRVKATSAPFYAGKVGGSMRLEERAIQLRWVIGTPTGPSTDISSNSVNAAQFPGGATAARYREYQAGTLVEITRSSGIIDTFLVSWKHLTEYMDRGAWHGALGLPMRDVRCGLSEQGCVQWFSGGSVYVNNSALSRGRYVALGRTDQTEYTAMALSQVGYEERSWRRNKYNDWMGAVTAWCGTFVQYSLLSGGHGYQQPSLSNNYDTYVSRLRSSGELVNPDRDSSRVKPGTVVLFDWGTGNPTHSGIVVRKSGSTIWTVEGNTTDGSGDPQRGVYYRQRSMASVWHYYNPEDWG